MAEPPTEAAERDRKCGLVFWTPAPPHSDSSEGTSEEEDEGHSEMDRGGLDQALDWIVQGEEETGDTGEKTNNFHTRPAEGDDDDLSDHGVEEEEENGHAPTRCLFDPPPEERHVTEALSPSHHGPRSSLPRLIRLKEASATSAIADEIPPEVLCWDSSTDSQSSSRVSPRPKMPVHSSSHDPSAGTRASNGHCGHSEIPVKMMKQDRLFGSTGPSKARSGPPKSSRQTRPSPVGERRVPGTQNTPPAAQLRIPNVLRPDLSKVESRVQFPRCGGYTPPRSRCPLRSASLSQEPSVVFRSPADIVKEALLTPDPDLRTIQEATVLIDELQEDNYRLKIKCAEKENTIDRLRFEGKVNLFSDPPEPGFLVHSDPRTQAFQPLTVEIPCPQRAQFSSSLQTGSSAASASAVNCPSVAEKLHDQGQKFLQELEAYEELPQNGKSQTEQQTKVLLELFQRMKALENNYVSAKEEQRRQKMDSLCPRRDAETLAFQRSRMDKPRDGAQSVGLATPTHTPPLSLTSPPHSPPLSLTSPPHTPPLNLTSPPHSPPLSLTSPPHTPPLSLTSPPHTPPLSLTSSPHTPPLSLTPPTHTPRLSLTPPTHTPRLSLTPPTHTPPIGLATPTHTPATPTHSLPIQQATPTLPLHMPPFSANFVVDGTQCPASPAPFTPVSSVTSGSDGDEDQDHALKSPLRTGGSDQPDSAQLYHSLKMLPIPLVRDLSVGPVSTAEPAWECAEVGRRSVAKEQRPHRTSREAVPTAGPSALPCHSAARSRHPHSLTTHPPTAQTHVPGPSRGCSEEGQSPSSSLSSLRDAPERTEDKALSKRPRGFLQDGVISPETDSGFLGSEESRLTPAAAASPVHQREPPGGSGAVDLGPVRAQSRHGPSERPQQQQQQSRRSWRAERRHTSAPHCQTPKTNRATHRESSRPHSNHTSEEDQSEPFSGTAPCCHRHRDTRKAPRPGRGAGNNDFLGFLQDKVLSLKHDLNVLVRNRDRAERRQPCTSTPVSRSDRHKAAHRGRPETLEPKEDAILKSHTEERKSVTSKASQTDHNRPVSRQTQTSADLCTRPKTNHRTPVLVGSSTEKTEAEDRASEAVCPECKARSKSTDGRLKGNSPNQETHCPHCRPCGAAESDWFGPTVLHCVHLCPLRLYSCPPTQSEGSPRLQALTEGSSRRSVHSTSLEASLNRALRAALSMKKTSRHMVHTLAQGHQRELSLRQTR